MDYRQLGHSGLRVSALTLGTMTFGGRDRFSLVGDTDVAGATRQIDMCLDRGVNFIYMADVYVGGVSKEVVGHAIKGLLWTCPHPQRCVHAERRWSESTKASGASI